MATQKKDFEKMWLETKHQVLKLSKETLDLLKKGEKEVVKASGKAKISIEIMVLKAKKEQLYYLIGKESVKRGKTSKVDKLVKEVKSLNSQIGAQKKLLKKAK
ncbi:hypothetical protein ACFL2Y_01025 [Candidatus Omnitrophota bacterium]